MELKALDAMMQISMVNILMNDIALGRCCIAMKKDKGLTNQPSRYYMICDQDIHGSFQKLNHFKAKLSKALSFSNPRTRV